MARAGSRWLVPEWMQPMLAKPDGGRLRSGPNWAYEYKLDGYRASMQVAQLSVGSSRTSGTSRLPASAARARKSAKNG
jgi:ATP-dependent DNA ligase